MSNEYEHTRALGISFNAADFHSLNYHARKHKMPVKEFIEWAMRCYVKSMRAEEQKRAK
ncbi:MULTISPECIES: hypothetical protein [Pseudomonas]|uniref:Uncharacterized protein n=1 Tax=Pseudomonas juntendi TaxID=2666183 RepID=A0A7W2QWU5_9PSED|nr:MULTISPECIES: hypothetical protein [Pseudomonas]MBA6145799.1 hypothetical protein [Pseudomonas juntendi]MDG9810613.1 hypothetical protein [Pseudomonas juntendi]